MGRARENPRLLLMPEEANNALDLARRIGQTARVEVEVRGNVPRPTRRSASSKASDPRMDGSTAT
ncbi:MAG: hypothetical protein HY319_05455 [Armatimonadetes bacterium]|nr:hypothetical protein [Armatimonadota bacterium]